MNLTTRQQKILELLVSSPDDQAQVAKHLALSYATLKREINIIFRETGAGTRLELIHMAIHQNLAPCPCGARK